MSRTRVLNPSAPSPARHPIRRTLLLTVVVAGLIAFWDMSRVDLPMARYFGDAHGFPWRDHWIFSTVLHECGRAASWALAMALSIGVWWPWGPLHRLTTSRRVQLAVTGLAAAAAVAWVKSASATSCPWDLHDFGGLALHVSHWDWGVQDGGSGRCFPAGHASSGFAFVGGWFVFDQHPRLARRWLIGSLAAGTLFGLAQQARGAHFMSHTLWTGWSCWTVAWVIDLAWPGPRSKVPA